MNFSFDCTQLVGVRRGSNSLDPSDTCKLLSEIWEADVKYADQIESVKMKYIREYSKLSLELFEFLDKEFIGEFEDWQDVQFIPKRIRQFEACIKTLSEFGYVVEIVCIINTPTQNQDRVHETTSEALIDALYSMSLFHTGEGAGCETLIVNLDTPSD